LIDTWKANNPKIITWINNFYRYAVGEVWDNKGGLGSSAKVIHVIKIYKTIFVREWHMRF
jgi:hypothetical protein